MESHVAAIGMRCEMPWDKLEGLASQWLRFGRAINLSGAKDLSALAEHVAEGLEVVALAERHPSVGEARGIGLFWLIELVRDRATREPLSPFNAPPSPAMQQVAAALRARGLFAYVRWNWLFCAPPLTITPEEMDEALAIIDEVLEIADDHTV